MITRELKILFAFISLLFFNFCNAQSKSGERHIRVSMRMIGHQILLNSGDSISRVLPVEKENDQYKISFESGFKFSPEELVKIIRGVVDETKIADNYLVEVEKCETDIVVYSFEIRNSNKQDLIPCQFRGQPKDCYAILFTVLDEDNSSKALSRIISDAITDAPVTKKKGYPTILIIAVSSLFLVGLLVSVKKRKKGIKPNTDPSIIDLGNCKFDKRNLEISYENERIKLTSKEADLLFLLYKSINNTLERDTILKTVWGDEGDYIGRTLDVFISKLRKKLEIDSSLKIVNVRGIGYRLVTNHFI